MIPNGNVTGVFTDGGNEMMIKKILFWLFVIAVGFINPLLSVALIVLYYLPKIISDACNSEPHVEISGMKSFSDDVMEKMK